MNLFKRKTGKKAKWAEKKTYDKEHQKPVIKCSICNGEQVVGFQDLRTGTFTEVQLIQGDGDLAMFKEQYGITGEIGKIY